MAQADNEQRELALRLETFPFVSFALEQRGIPFVHFAVENLTADVFEGATLDIELAPELGDRQSFPLPRLLPGEKGVLPVDYRLAPGRLRQVVEAERGQLTWAVRRSGVVLGHDARPIDIHPFNQWPGAHVLPALLAMFVTPNHAQVAQTLQLVRDRLRQQTGNASLEGYQSRNPSRVRSFVKALYETIQSLGITYAEAPPSFEKIGQKIRLADRLFRDQIGCCLDISVFFAACLEQMGLNPLLVVIEGHAFHGVWLADEFFPELMVDDPARIRNLIKLGQLLVLDSSTNLKTPAQSFEAAVSVAQSYLADDEVFEHAIDIRTARRSGFKPIPLRESQNEPSESPVLAPIEELVVQAPARANSGGPAISTRPKPEPPPPATAARFRKWQERLLDLTLRNRLLNLGRAGRGWLPLEVPDLGLFEDILSTGQSIEILPKPEPEADAVFAEQRTDKAALHQRLLADLRRGTVYVPAATAVLRAIGKRLELARRIDLEEGGANSLYAAIGVLKWCEPGGADFHLAPLLLYPIELTVERARNRLQLRRLSEEPIGNPTLCEKLRREHQIDLTALVDLEPDEQGVDVPRLIQGVRTAIQSKAGWEVIDLACIGQFTFTKFLMWKDLEENAKVLCQNDVVRHIAERDSRFVPSGREVTPDELDVAFAPDALPCILNADSTQMAAVAGALSGRSFVLQGPPGTGKSQTIANLIAAAAAQGKTVLFVSEKMAALEVVYRRLAEAGLDDFCLELHSNKSNKRGVLDSLARAFRRELRAGSTPWAERSSELAVARAMLNSHAHAVNDKRSCGESFYALSSKQLEQPAELDLGFSFPDVDQWDETRLRRAEELVAELVPHAARVEPVDQQPWRASKQTEWSSGLEESLRAVLGQARAQLDDLGGRLAALCSLLAVPVPKSTASAGDLAALAAIRVEGPIAPAAFGPGFAAVAARASAYVAARRAHEQRRTALAAHWKPQFLVDDLSPFEARFGRWAHALFFLAWIFLWSARRALSGMSQAKLPSNAEIFEDLAAARVTRDETANLAAQQTQVEQALGGTWSADVATIDELDALIARSSRAHAAASRLAGAGSAVGSLLSETAPAPSELGDCARALQDAIERLSASEISIQRLLAIAPGQAWPLPGSANHRDDLRSQLDRWQRSLASLRPWCLYRRACAALEVGGIGVLSVAHGSGAISASHLEAAFRKTFYARLVVKIRDTDPTLRSFSGASHHRLVDRFTVLDGEHIDLARRFIAGRLEERLPRFGNAIAESSEPGILAREIQKKARHLPIRKLLGAIPNLLPKLKPCLLMSPLSVAQYLPADGRRFDLVVFDEASQIGTHDAIGAIARGNQVVVVGDSKQLPPTAFFTRVGDDSEALPDENNQVELESILDEAVAKGLPQQMLGWHYRSRHHSLIEFSNRAYYDGKLHVFPSAARELPELGVCWHSVPHGVYYGSSSETNPRTNPVEARVLVDSLVGSLRAYAPEQRTFGVVTFSMAQKALIDDLLDEARGRFPEIEPHFRGGEGVFVKNLENVQGDERDEILFSICYAKDERGKLRLHFGPLSNKGGERRLNVAITRARVQLRVFSTMTHDEIDLSRTDSRGAKDLKSFLEYAARRGAPDERALNARNAHFASHFERDIRNVVASWGYEVHSGVGAGDYKVDLAVVHPKEPGEYLLGIECDGPSYASAKTARERDRLRRQVLEGLRWKLHRIWSSDWELDREVEIARLRRALEAALVRAPAATLTPHTAAAIVPVTEIGQATLDAVEEARGRIAAPEAASEVRLQSLAPGAVAAQSNATPSSPARPYRIAEMPLVSAEPDSLYFASSDPHIQNAIAVAVAKEAPVHVDVVGRRVIACFGLGKLTGKATARIGEVITRMARQRLIAKYDHFLWPTGQDPLRYEGFRCSSADGAIPDLQLVAPEEIGNAAAWVLQQNLSLERADLARETARILGVTRMGKNVVVAVDAGIDSLITRGVCMLDGNRVVWKGTTV